MQQYNPQIHHRRSIRLKNYDYAQAGLYFITLCCQHRAMLFGDVVNGSMVLNAAGQIADNCWLEIPQHFPNVVLHDYVIMPNHVHGILELTHQPNPPALQAHQPVCNDEVNAPSTNDNPGGPVGAENNSSDISVEPVAANKYSFGNYNSSDNSGKPVGANKYSFDNNSTDNSGTRIGANKYSSGNYNSSDNPGKPVGTNEYSPDNPGKPVGANNNSPDNNNSSDNSGEPVGANKYSSDNNSPDNSGEPVGANKYSPDNNNSPDNSGTRIGANGNSPDNNNSPDNSGTRIGANGNSPLRSPSKTVGSIVRGYKIGVTKWMRQNTPVYDVWQRNYYENIIRDWAAYERIAQYIRNNPTKWTDDRFHEK